MTTPDPLDELDLMLPFGIKFTARDGVTLPAYSADSLPYGIHTLQVAWDGSSGLIVRRSTARLWATTTEIGRIPAGEGRRSLIIPGVVVDGNAYLSTGISGPDPADGSTVSIVVTTVPLV